jgi:hypothetical protein
VTASPPAGGRGGPEEEWKFTVPLRQSLLLCVGPRGEHTSRRFITTRLPGGILPTVTYYGPNHFIEIIGEKRLQNASKGRNQWIFLQKFDGKRVIDFFEAAKVAARRAAPATYQEGNWWEREIDYCRSKGVVRIAEKTPVPKPAATAPAQESASHDGQLPPAERDFIAQPPILSQPGLYLVTLNNEEPISANAHDPRLAATSIHVNRDNCKFGKAQNLDARKQNYRTTFGEQNVNFFCIAALLEQDLDRAEQLVSNRLNDYRAKGPSERITEWMQGVDAMEVRSVTKRSTASRFSLRRLTRLWAGLWRTRRRLPGWGSRAGLRALATSRMAS